MLGQVRPPLRLEYVTIQGIWPLNANQEIWLSLLKTHPTAKSDSYVTFTRYTKCRARRA